jgi:hypothetical protein
MIVLMRNHRIGDVKKLGEKLLFEEGIKNTRFLKRGKSLITAMKMTEFRSDIDFGSPLLYISRMPAHDAPFALQSDRIVVKAETETKANELIDIFISKHQL